MCQDRRRGLDGTVFLIQCTRNAIRVHSETLSDAVVSVRFYPRAFSGSLRISCTANGHAYLAADGTGKQREIVAGADHFFRVKPSELLCKNNVMGIDHRSFFKKTKTIKPNRKTHRPLSEKHEEVYL